jgi:hypothetical protein
MKANFVAGRSFFMNVMEEREREREQIWFVLANFDREREKA